MSALTDVFTNIANAIRTLTGVSTTYKPSDMANAIKSIPRRTANDTNLYFGIEQDHDTKMKFLAGYYPNDWTVSARQNPTGGYSGHNITVWTNPNPSASSFAEQTINLSKQATYTTGICLSFEFADSNISSFATPLFGVDRVERRYLGYLTNGAYFYMIGGYSPVPSTTDIYFRYVYFTNSQCSQIKVSNCYKVGSTGTYNDRLRIKNINMLEYIH